MNSWLKIRTNDYEWVRLLNYSWNLKNKYFKMILEDGEEYGYILKKKSENEYLVYINRDIKIMNLNEIDCFIDKGPITNREFCEKNGLKLLNYLKKQKEFNVILSDKDFIYKFSEIVYNNSKL